MMSRWTRREFVRSAAGAVAMAKAAGVVAAPVQTGLRGRFLTHVSVVRVNQIEVTPTRSIGQDEVADNSVEHVSARREAFGRGCPGGRMTWAISWLALYDQRQQYKDVRRLLASYHDKFGDEVTFIPGGYFAPMYATREENRKTIHTALGEVSKMVGGGYRPQCLVAGFLDAENQQHLANDEGIHVCQGQIWSQHGIDNGDGDGGICYPYYPSTEHYLKPAQGKADFIDCVCLDGWTCDFLTARREGFEGKFNSRQGVGPIETVQDLGEAVGRQEMMGTTAMHFDAGHALNGFGFVTGIWETSLGNHQHLEWWLQQVRERWPDTRVMTEGEFGLEWRKHVRNNAGLNYRFDAKGTGAPGSEKDLELEWYMNQEFRLALLGPAADKSKRMAIDFTRYDLPVHEPQGLQREWSLMNVLNQKGTRPQDKPKRLGELAAEDQRMIFSKYPELKRLA
ncbi:DUF3863 domain-containing protein [Occallatibacter riparius]|uniref:DUF3863 domain-containing protein n=1 Tax=Occallatibacter riparius TaxID=1002689 RepID=A0A9J7BQD1_9BACT|nr:DUF3863 domain-containing protein [Occallatibacter riparius]UWZ83954.1 DUF3863 domain-containing protein [Occallatibacter riparius]